MSLLRLHSYLKQNSHDVLDYWILREKIRYVRVISRKNGYVYMIRVDQIDIEAPPQTDVLEKSTFYFLEESHKPRPSLDGLMTVMGGAGCVIEGYYVCFREGEVFQIRNMSDTENLGFFLLVDMTKFYDNVYVINHEIEKKYKEILQKTRDDYADFLPAYRAFTTTENTHKVSRVWECFEKDEKLSDEVVGLYLRVCSSENRTIHDIDFYDTITEAEDLTLQETVRRTQMKRSLVHKLDRLATLKNKILEKVLFYHCARWKIILRVRVMISRFTRLKKEFHGMVYELETVVPPAGAAGPSAAFSS
jgi:hypothetical protein